MKYSRKATSIIEAMIVLLVVVTGITWVYWLLVSSQKLANTTGNRIEAIQIARDWLEAFTNIRDTNWVRFAADYENCWNALNYDDTCIWNDTDLATRIRWWAVFSGPDAWKIRRFMVYKNSSNNFILEDRLEDPSWFSYWSGAIWEFRDVFRVGIDSRGFYTQSGSNIDVDILPIFTRTLKTNYVDTDWNWTDQSRFDDKIIVTALVEWVDSSSTKIQKVEMSTTLTNWKAKK